MGANQPPDVLVLQFLAPKKCMLGYGAFNIPLSIIVYFSQAFGLQVPFRSI